ncbi:MAG: GNAT family N-acetyltransferase [Oscillospiraceae bacterium]|jgi:putative acetyltransferase|nr:GNAT family N-acetyltransferase [Oscillospiraceae bacterium]MBQ6850312.1 GNAT family N-acetyltransferase [Oscillospiraceae bacterium]
MKNIRQATEKDLSRIAEIEIFNYRLNFYPIFKSDWFYFEYLTVPSLMEKYAVETGSFYVYDDGVIKGFVKTSDNEIQKLFVEPVLQGNKIGDALVNFATEKLSADNLWALEKNTKAIKFYEKHGFELTGEKKFEEDTTEYLVKLKLNK